MSSQRASAGPPRGIVRGPPPPVEHRRLLPAPDLASWVAHLWSVRWSLAAPSVAETLPHPCVHVVTERAGGEVVTRVHGVPTRRFVKELRGEGRVFGVKLRPGVFPALAGIGAARLKDREVEVGDVFGDAGAAFARAMADAGGLDDEIAAAEAFMRAVRRPLPAEAEAIRDLVERMAADRSLVRVDQVAAAAGLDVRTLQRRFTHHVGASPKLVLRRYRLHEAVARLAEPDAPSQATLAAELGYADESHFIRDYRALIGEAPGRTRARARGTDER